MTKLFHIEIHVFILSLLSPPPPFPHEDLLLHQCLTFGLSPAPSPFSPALAVAFLYQFLAPHFILSSPSFSGLPFPSFPSPSLLSPSLWSYLPSPSTRPIPYSSLSLFITLLSPPPPPFSHHHLPLPESSCHPHSAPSPLPPPPASKPYLCSSEI